MVKKFYKPSKTEILNFVKVDKKASKGHEESYITADVNALDSESIMMLKKLLNFTSKEELFRVLLKQPLKDKQSKKSVILSIIPTDVEEESEVFDIKKKKYISIKVGITATPSSSC